MRKVSIIYMILLLMCGNMDAKRKKALIIGVTGQDGAYRKVGPHDSLVFENEKTPFHPLTRKSKPFKKMSKKEADDLPF